MNASDRAARIAAWLILIVMLIHNLNALYIEPTYLGFVDKARDYGDMAKIEDATWSFSFISSGLGHAVCGFSLLILGLALYRRFRDRHELASQLLMIAALLAGTGFLLTGISDIPGAMYSQILRGINPDYNTEILLITTMIRSILNVLGIVGLGWFAGQLAWLTLATGDFPSWFGWYGWLLVLPALLSFPFPPAGFLYIQLTVVWAGALALFLGRRPAHRPATQVA